MSHEFLENLNIGKSANHRRDGGEGTVRRRAVLDLDLSKMLEIVEIAHILQIMQIERIERGEEAHCEHGRGRQQCAQRILYSVINPRSAFIANKQNKDGRGQNEDEHPDDHLLIKYFLFYPEDIVERL